MLSEVLRGGYDVVTAAGASIVGGHTIEDPSPNTASPSPAWSIRPRCSPTPVVGPVICSC